MDYKLKLMFLVTVVLNSFMPSVQAQNEIVPQLKTPIQQAILLNKNKQIKNLEADKTALEAEAVANMLKPKVTATGLYAYQYSNGNLDLAEQNLPILNTALFSGSQNFTVHNNAALVGVNAQQVIFSGLQIQNAQKALQEKSTAMRFMAQSEDETIAKDVISTFDQLMLLNEVEQLIADSEKRLIKEEQRVTEAIKNGFGIPYDREKIKLALLELNAKKVELAGNKELLYKKLQHDTKMDLDSLQNIQYQLSEIFINNLPENVQERSEIKALNASGKAYEYLYKKEKGAHLPTVFALANAHYGNIFSSKLTIKDIPKIGDYSAKMNHLQFAPGFFVGVGVKWDIFTGGEHKNKLKQVAIDQNINQIKLQETDEMLRLLLDKNKINYNTANQKIVVGKQQIKVATNNLDLAARQFKEGLIDMTERLATENEWYKVNIDYYTQILSQRNSAIELLHTSGTLLNTLHY